MDKTEKIINAIKQGKKPVEVSAILGKDGFTPAEQEKLVGQVADLWDTPFSYPLLQTMYLISRDEWYRLKVLSLTVQHPTQIGENRAEILNNLEKTLNGLKATSPEQKRTWTRCQAIYLGIEALTLTEEGNLSKALQLYKQALEKYHQLGLATPAARVQANIVHLQSRMMTRMITPDELSKATSSSKVEEEPRLRVVYQPNENLATPEKSDLPVTPQTSEMILGQNKVENIEKPAETDGWQTEEIFIPLEKVIPADEQIQETNETNKGVLDEDEHEQSTDMLADRIRTQISEYLTQQNQSPSIDESEDQPWQQTSEYPSKQNTTPPTGEFTEPVWWQAGEGLLDQDQIPVEQTPALPMEQPAADNFPEKEQTPSSSQPSQQVEEQAGDNISASASILSTHEIQDDISQLYDKHNQVRSEIESLQQKIDEQFRDNVEKLLTLADHLLSLERQIQHLEQRAKELAAHR